MRMLYCFIILFSLFLCTDAHFHPFSIISRHSYTGKYIEESYENLPDLFNKTPRIEEDGLDMVYLPVYTTLFKAMKTPSQKILSQTDVLNVRATASSWLANMRVAMHYSEKGYGNVVAFLVTKSLKLFDISIANNWNILWERILDKLKSVENEIIPKNIRNYALLNEIKQRKIKKIKMQLNIIQLTTGYNATWEEQIHLLHKYGSVFNPNHTANPQEELNRRHCHKNDWFYNIKTNQSIILKSRNTTFGPRQEDLNRLSYVTRVDDVMANTITEYLNVDGYYSPEFPSLFEEKGFLDEEVAIRIPRDSLNVIKRTCPNGEMPCSLSCFHPKHEECSPDGIHSKKKTPLKEQISIE